MPRRLRRFFVDRIFSERDPLVQLSARETFHLRQVLRLKKGDRCEVFNRNSWGAEALIETVSEEEGAEVRLKKIFPLEQPSIFLRVGQGFPQKRKMDDLVEKAQELGVQELWVLETKRTVAKMSAESRVRARTRWERIAVEAAKQSGAATLLQVEGPLKFQKVLEEKLSPTDTAFLFHPDPPGLSFSEFIEGLKISRNKARRVSLFFGPEGGFTPEEVKCAESRGVRKVFLGDSVLRLETAFLGVISAIRFLFPG